jgi:oligopeptide/dipeptide ABC transporter ATP-binding protein
LENESLVRVESLTKWFSTGRGISTLFGNKQSYVRAVDEVSFEIKEKENFGLVGESGCGKSTTGRLLLGLIRPTKGEVFFKGINTETLRKKDRKDVCRKMQIIFQNPYGCLNPKLSIFDLLAEPLVIHKAFDDKAQLSEKVSNMLEIVELKPAEDYIGRFPHELSGGQRQRIAIGRALMLQPQFIVADEPVSSLDVSTRGGILKLLLRLKEQYSLSMLFITHDLAVSRHVCDRIAVMYLGKIDELSESNELIDSPIHPYTEALISALPTPDPTDRGVQIHLKGEISSAAHLPDGCRFNPRCPYVSDVCREKEPEFREIKTGHFVACHNV